jgi:hypothetical protein
MLLLLPPLLVTLLPDNSLGLYLLPAAVEMPVLAAS